MLFSEIEEIFMFSYFINHSFIVFLEGKKTAPVFEDLLSLPICMLRPSLAISWNIILDPVIATEIEEKIPVPSSKYLY